MTLTAEPHGGSTDQRTVGAEFGRCDDRALRVLQIGHPVDLDLGSREERVTESQGDRAGDHGELQIEQIGKRTDGSADEPAGPDAFRFVGRFGGTTRAGSDAGATDLGLQHALHMGVELGALGFDHDMTDAAGVAVVAVEQSAIEDDAAADAGRHDHANEVRHAAGPALPCLTERKRLLRHCRRARPGRCSASRVRSGKSRQTGMLIGDTASPACRMGPPQPTPQTPTGRHRGMCCDLVEKFRQSNEQGLGVGDIRRRRPPPIDDRPVHTDDADLDLRATDIDRQDVLHERHRRAASDQPPGP